MSMEKNKNGLVCCSLLTRVGLIGVKVQTSKYLCLAHNVMQKSHSGCRAGLGHESGFQRSGGVVSPKSSTDGGK